MINKSHSFDYVQLLTVAVNFLGLAPSEFWLLTPGEFTALVQHKLKIQGAGDDNNITKVDIDELHKLHPPGRQYTVVTKELLKRDVRDGCNG